MKQCISCGRVTEYSPCSTCRSERNRARDEERGSRQDRGYDADFDRAKVAPAYVNATHCATCHEPFTPQNPKTAGHRTALRRGGGDGSIIAQCRRCNYGWRKTDQ